MSEHSYHNDFDSVSKTMLAHFHESPHEYWRYYVSMEAAPPQPKAAVIGAIGHDVLLTDSQLADVAIVYPPDCLKKNGAINPTPARAFEASLDPGQYAVKQQVFDQIDCLLATIAKHEVVQLIASADARETPIYWEDSSGVACRCRPDFLCLTDEGVVAYDPKFTSMVKPGEFWRAAKMFRYWMQDAHYSAGIQAKYEMPVKFVFWAIEDKPPHRIARYEYTRDSRENASEEVAGALADLAARRAGGYWKDDWTAKTNSLYFQPHESNRDELDWGTTEVTE